MACNGQLYGLVVCGGVSTRMGTDKGMLVYHGKPQMFFLYEMLAGICDKVFIACRKEQAAQIPEQYAQIPDRECYRDTGPVAALLSAFDQWPEASFLAVGCDYPFLEKKHLQHLVSFANRYHRSVAFCQEGTDIIEPLIAVYQHNISHHLASCFKQGNHSLRRILMSWDTLAVTPENNCVIQSVDKPEAYIAALQLLQKTRGGCGWRAL